jgi:TonB family protein
MLPTIALSFALLAPQATAPDSPPPNQPPTAQVPSQQSSAPDKSAGGEGTPGVRRVGGGVSSPRVNLIVDANGNPTNVHVLRSMADTVDKKHRKAALTLDQKAIEAVQKYRFSPATEGGKPVAVELNVEVNFQIF